MRAFLLIFPVVAFSIRVAVPGIPVLLEYYSQLLKADPLNGSEVVIVENEVEALEMLRRGEVDVAVGVPYIEGSGVHYYPLPLAKIKVGAVGLGNRIGKLRGWPGPGRVYERWNDLEEDVASGKIERAVGPYPVLLELAEKLNLPVESTGKVVLRFVASSRSLNLEKYILEIYKGSRLPEGMRDPFTLTMEVINFPPYEYFEGKEWKGVDVEVVERVLEGMGFRLDLVSFPPVRAFAMIESGEIDGAFSLERTPKRERILIFPDEPISRGFDVFFHRKGEDISLQNLEGKTSGYVPGYVTEEVLTSLGLILFPVKNDESGITLVSKGRIDVFMTNFLVGRFFIEKNGIYNLAWTLPIRIYDSYVAFSKIVGMELIAREFERRLREFKKGKEYREILERYGLSREDIWAPPR